MNKCTFGIKNFTKNRESPFNDEGLSEGAKTEVIKISKPAFSKVIGLSRTSLKLLLYFITHSNGSNTVYFDLSHCKRLLGFKDKRSVYNALIELLGEKIIARTEKENIYYLNENIISINELLFNRPVRP